MNFLLYAATNALLAEEARSDEAWQDYRYLIDRLGALIDGLVCSGSDAQMDKLRTYVASSGDLEGDHPRGFADTFIFACAVDLELRGEATLDHLEGFADALRQIVARYDEELELDHGKHVRFEDKQIAARRSRRQIDGHVVFLERTIEAKKKR